MPANNIAAARYDTGIQHAGFHCVPESFIIHLNRIQGIGQGHNRIKMLVGFTVAARFTGALHADMAVGIDKRRGQYVKFTKQLSFGGFGYAGNFLAVKNKISIGDN